MEYKVLRLLFGFLSEYVGNPLYISGNAIRHAFHKKINTSVGCFTELRRLDAINSYEAFIKIRIEKPFLIPHTQSFFSKIERKKKHLIYFTPTSITFDIINPPENLINFIKNLNIIQLGGLRNEGFGAVELLDHLLIDLKKIEYPDIGTHVTLISPILYVPKFLETYQCRQEYVIFWNNSKKNRIKIISPGQFFRIKKNKNIKKIAEKGILRKVLFGQFGFGEFFVNNWPKEEENE